MTEAIPQLATAFGRAGYDDWRALVEQALKGASIDDRLVSLTRDGLAVRPVYPRAADAPAQPAPVHAGAWTVVQRIEHPDIDTARALLRADIAGGATGIELVFNSSLAAHGAGIGVETVDDFDRLFDGVDLAAVALQCTAGYETRHVAALILALLRRRGVDPAAVRLRLVNDPISHFALRGRLNVLPGPLHDRLADLVRGLAAGGLPAQSLTPDGRLWHYAGATEAQELAVILASAVHYLRALEGCGIAPAEAAACTGFALAADADQFMTMAKVRALRRLWARVREATGLAPAPVHIHAETAWRMMAARDAHANILRATLAAFAAGVAGADSVAVLPFTVALGVPDALARRIARNLQIVLQEEASLCRVRDPAAGSGAAEALTDALAREAWRLFREIEAGGGIVAALRSGRVQGMIAAARDGRIADVCRLEETIIGVNAYANLGESAPPAFEVEAAEVRASNLRLSLPPVGDGRHFRALADAAAAGITLADMALAQQSPAPDRIDETILPVRLAAPFEALRAASERELRLNGTRPHVFLARLGPREEHAARADWVRDVLATGGLAVLDEHVHATAAEAAERFAQTGARIACICGSDETCAADAADAARALTAAGARAVILAGRPGAQRAAFEAAGIGLFLHKGCDVVRLMAAALAAAGIRVDFGPLAGLVAGGAGAGGRA